MKRPGAGLMLLVAVVIASASFFAWGLRTPPLERVYRIQLELRLGTRGLLAPSELALIESSMRDHPVLAANWIGDDQPFAVVSANQDGLVENGYAYVLRKNSARRQALELTATDAKIDQPIPVELRAGEASTTGHVEPGKTLTWELPRSAADRPQLVEVGVKYAKKKRPPAIVVRARELP